MANLTVTFTGKGAVEIRKLDRPESLAADEILIETSCSLISTGTEGIALERKFERGTNWHQWVKYPFYPGYCGVGRVVEVGADVALGETSPVPGKVSVPYRLGDRVCTWSPHQHFAVGRAARTSPLPDEITDEEAAWLPIAVIVQHGFRKAQVAHGETVVVVGLGMLGQLVVQYAKLAGASQVIAIDPAQFRLAMAAVHGATKTVRTTAEKAKRVISELTGGQMADVVFDMTGHADAFAASQWLLGEFGRLVLIGDSGYPSKQRLTSNVMLNNLTIIGAHQRLAARMPRWHHQRLSELFLEDVAAERIQVKYLITHRFPAAEATAAYDLLRTDRDHAMGVVLIF